MKLLLDANLSWRLIKKLDNHFNSVVHVDSELTSHPAKDIEIWNYALENHFVVVTNDEDFLNLLLSKGFPPKVILIRTGNQSTQSIANLILDKKYDIFELQNSSEIGVLQIF